MFSKNTLSSKGITISEGEINAFSGKQKLREFITTRHALEEMLSRNKNAEVHTTLIGLPSCGV